jgi:RNase H-like domain found in reverse transcriptase/Integrase core domain/Chromo (CHRromatin Organisation MOdifier) domain/Integrase zinc binding domain/Retrotransposon gag protein
MVRQLSLASLLVSLFLSSFFAMSCSMVPSSSPKYPYAGGASSKDATIQRSELPSKSEGKDNTTASSASAEGMAGPTGDNTAPSHTGEERTTTVLLGTSNLFPSALSSQSASTASSIHSRDCKFFIEELIHVYQLAFKDICPLCSSGVFTHRSSLDLKNNILSAIIASPSSKLSVSSQPLTRSFKEIKEAPSSVLSPMTARYASESSDEEEEDDFSTNGVEHHQPPAQVASQDLDSSSNSSISSQEVSHRRALMASGNGNGNVRVPTVSLVTVSKMLRDVKWPKSRSPDFHSDQFFTQIENKLSIFPRGSSDQWIPALPALIEDARSATWVRENIVEASSVTTWAQAKKTFSRHFDVSVLDDLLEDQYAECKQNPKETVQSYTDRFLDLCHQLGYDSDVVMEKRSVKDLVKGLHPYARKQYKTFKSMVNTQDSSNSSRFDRMHEVVRILIELSINSSIQDQSSGKPQQSEQGKLSSVSSGKKLSCKFHPNSSSHSTAQCKMNKANQQLQNKSNSTPSSTPTNSNTNKGACHLCGSTDHWKPNCPLNKFKQPNGTGSGGSVANRPSQQYPANNMAQGGGVKSKGIKSENQFDVLGEEVDSKSTSTSPSNTLSKSVKHGFVQVDEFFNETEWKREWSEESNTDKQLHMSPYLRAINAASGNQSEIDLQNNIAVFQTVVGKSMRPSVFAVLHSHNDFIVKASSDSGCDKLVIDEELAKSLSLPIIPPDPNNLKESKRIILGDGSSIPRIGATPALPLTFIFFGAELPCPPITVNISCEVMKGAADHSYGTQMIFGVDAIQKCIRFLQLKNHSPVPLMPYILGHSIAGLNPTPNNMQCKSLHVTADSAKEDMRVSMAAAAWNNQEDCVESVSFSVDDEKIEECTQWRDKILTDPLVRQQIEINNAIPVDSFVRGEDAVVHLKLKEDSEEIQKKLFRKQYPIAEAKKALMRSTIEKWRDTKRIEPCPFWQKFNNPLLGVAKMEGGVPVPGKVRVCIDPGPINKLLETGDKFPIPHVGKNLEQFAGNTLFGEIDLSDCFLQFMLHPDSRKYCVFSGVPFGLHFMSAFVHRFVSFKFADMKFVGSFVDNIAFASKSWLEHRDQLVQVLQRCNELNLRVKTSSIKVGYTRMRCLGFIVSSRGILVDPRKMSIIANWEKPSTGAGLQSFLGIACFVRHHVRHYADLSAPLEAVKNMKVIPWTDTLEVHFNLLKKAIMNAPLLTFPDFSRPFYLATDASNVGIGGVLYQPAEGEIDIKPGNIVAICSKILNESQRNYSAYKKELYALVYSLRKFHVYLWGRNDSVLFTDHKPLTFMFETPSPSPAVQQWLDELLMYNFTVHHRPGILNILPDALSRMYDQAYDKSPWGVPANYRMLGNLAASSSFSSHTVEQKDPTKGLSLAVKPVQTRSKSSARSVSETHSSQPPSDYALSAGEELDENTSSNETQARLSERQSLGEVTISDPNLDAAESAESSNSDSVEIHAQLLVEMERLGKRIPTSQRERDEFIQKEHSLGHFGRDAIFNSLYENHNLWWPGMRRNIQSIVSNCDACARFVVHKSGFKPSQFIAADGPWAHVQVDCITHLPQSHEGYTALVVFVDVFTGFLLCFPIETTSAKCIAEKLWLVCSMFGLPRILQSDNGPEFANQVVQEMTRLMHLDHRFISPWNPRTDGKVERANGVVMMVIKKLLQGSDRYWPFFAPLAQFCINSKISSLTQSTPFSLMFGRDAHQLTALKHSGKQEEVSIEAWKQFQKRLLSVIYPSIYKRILNQKEKMVNQIDASHNIISSEKSFPIGSHVMRLDPRRSDKREPHYIGPYVIKSRDANGNLILQDVADDSLVDRAVPPDQLKLKAPPSVGRGDSVEDEVFVVERILRHRGTFPEVEYLVKWKHYPLEESTWEPPSHFNDTSCIRKYWKEVELQQSNEEQTKNKVTVERN